jgi:hypothetical protein
MNLRVLIASMALALVVGAVLVGGFWHETPPRVDSSSGGNAGQNSVAPQPAQNSSTP